MVISYNQQLLIIFTDDNAGAAVRYFLGLRNSPSEEPPIAIIATLLHGSTCDSHNGGHGCLHNIGYIGHRCIFYV